MLGSKKRGLGVSGGTTLISRETAILGDIQFSGNLDVEGLVQGNIVAKPDSEACVRVIDKGRVEGDITAPSVVVNGSVEGDVYSSGHLELASKARVQGSVYYTLVEMAAGSEVNGSLQHVGSPAEASSVPKVSRSATSISPVVEQAKGKSSSGARTKVD